MKRTAWVFALIILMRPEAYAPPDPLWWTVDATKIRDASATANNYAPLNLGQLRNTATKAHAYLNDALSQFGGAGFELSLGTDTSSNYSPTNLGQLKAVAKPFYDRLIALGYNTKQNLKDRGYPSDWAFDYPWNNVTLVPASDNYGPANIGQPCRCDR